MASLEAGKITEVRTDYGALSCVRLYVETDANGSAVRRLHSSIDGELRFVCVSHEDDSNAATLSIYLEDALDNSMLDGESLVGLAAGSGAAIAKYKKLQYEDVGGAQPRELLLCGPQTFRFSRSAAVVTRLVVEFWFVRATG